MSGLSKYIDALEQWLGAYSAIAVAVSGGVDSLTLACLAHRHGQANVEMFHAISPAVPVEATRRVEVLGSREGWSLTVMDAGEFADPTYRANPVNRCYYCKSHLYGAIARCTSAQIVSGTNLDDLGEYRPGLEAATKYAVRHPYVEAGIDKETLRRISTWLGLGDVAALPAAPCLSSRIETAIVIEPEMLELVHALETLVTKRLHARTVRCRVRSRGMVVELDSGSFSELDPNSEDAIRREARALLNAAGRRDSLTFEPYRNGGAFLHAPGTT